MNNLIKYMKNNNNNLPTINGKINMRKVLFRINYFPLYINKLTIDYLFITKPLKERKYPNYYRTTRVYDPIMKPFLPTMDFTIKRIWF